MWMLLGILVVGALGGVCMAALRNVSGDVGGGMGRDYMEKECPPGSDPRDLRPPGTAPSPWSAPAICICRSDNR